MTAVPARSITATVISTTGMPVETGRPYLFQHTNGRLCAVVTRQLAPDKPMRLDGVGRVLIETQRPVLCNAFQQDRVTGGFTLIDPHSDATIAAGIIETAEATVPGAENHLGMAIWFTGLSSAGKSTLAQRVSEELRALGRRVEVLDGDAVRKHLCKDLGFSKEDRDENIRRIGFVAELAARNGAMAVVAVISPYRAIRDEIRQRIPNFVEVYVNAPLEVCEERDIKGLYRRARAGQLKGFTGIDDPYEPPLSPEVECRTGEEAVDDSVRKVLDCVHARIGMFDKWMSNR